MRRLGVPFRIVAPRVDESRGDAPAPVAFVQAASALKARAVARRLRRGIVVAADTMVVLDRVGFGKPADRAEARSMLRRLRGRPHTVVTGVHVLDATTGRQATGTSRSRVWMRPLTDARIKAYVRSGEPFGKAGAYAIQGKGAALVARYRGPYDNIVGLPLHLVRRLLAEVRFPPPAYGASRARRPAGNEAGETQ